MTDVDFLGAVASNAGDEFHVLWAAREMLRLLDSDGDVTAVKVEGPPSDEVHDQLGEHGQAADVTLICKTADGPVYRYLQLKHSASNPLESWTWSRLLACRAQKKPQSSVLGKLAGLMKAVAFKGDFSIVTNQPVSQTVVQDVERLVANGSKQAPEDAELIKRLTKALGLTKEQLLIFLRLWDLSGFSVASRLCMESEVLLRLASMYDADARDDANLLQKRVATLMLPESRNDSPVTRELLATWLGVGNERLLYPAPSRIKPANPYLRRSVMDALCAKLIESQKQPLRVHAGGGCGKTSLLCDLPSVLPEGSEVLLYDCYGGGLFLASDQKRHLPEQAFIQMGNQLAARLRTPLVLRRQGSIDVFEAFRNRVAVAAGLLTERNPNARLILCFDAVDNARKGALHWHEPCFIDTLSQASNWPDNVRIVVSCRTARLAEVGAESLYDDFEIDPLDVDEVEKLVALWQPTWRPELAPSFKDLTGGNPRRLVYAIEGLQSEGAARAIERLMPKAEGINPLFEQRVAEAGKHLGDAEKVWRVLDALANLPRPVPGDVLATLADIVAADINDIAVDVGGIVERKEGWSFHDEDFEAFVVDRPNNGGKAVLARAVELLLANQLTDRYAAIGVAEVLVAAGRLDALYALVTNNKQSSSALSPLEAQFVWSRRLSLAIRCCREASDITNACSLLIASAEAIGRARLLERLTVDNLDLSVRFAADESNRLVMVGQRHRGKRARLRIELARQAVLMHPGIAKIHLRWWNAHIRELHEAEHRDDFSVNAGDIAAEYAVFAALDGEELAFRRLFDWRPKSILLSVFQILAARAAGHNRQALRHAILARCWPPQALAPLMAAALLAGADITTPEMRGGLERLARATCARWPKSIEIGLSHAPILSWHEAILLIAECAVEHSVFHPLVSRILDSAFPKPEFRETHHLYRLLSAGARYARAHALREKIAGTFEEIAKWLPPQREVPPAPMQRRGRRDEMSPERHWNESLRQATLSYTRHVDAVRATLKGLSADPVAAWAEVAKALDISRTYEDWSRRDPDAALLLMRNHLVHVSLRGGDVASLVPLVRKVLQSWSADSIQRGQNLAETLALVPHAHDAVLGLLTTLATEIEVYPAPASERVKQLSKCSRIALPLDANLAEWLFNKAVGATVAVDFEARSALAAAGGMAMAGLGGVNAQTAQLAARLADAAGAVVKSLDLGGDFAWDKAAGWVSAVNFSTGLAAAIRWHDQGVASLHHSLPAVVKSSQAFTLAQRAALATLSVENGLDLDLDLAFGAEYPLPGWIVEFILQTLCRYGNVGTFLEGLAALENRAAADAAPAIIVAGHHRDKLAAWRASHDVNADALDEDEDDIVEEHTIDAPIQNIDEIRAALGVGDGPPEPSAHQFCEVAHRVNSRGLRVPFLEVALELAGTKGALGEAFPKIYKSWGDYPPVAEWARRYLPGYIAGALHELFYWGYDQTETLEAALVATGLEPIGQANILLDGIEREGERMSADMLYMLMGMIAARVPEKHRINLFDMLLQQVETRTSHSAQVRLTGLLAPEGTSESVARTLFAAMGDMDCRIRWRASHAALMLLRGGDAAWDRLVECLASEGSDIFRGEPFYRYGALEQLMVVIQRATLERPSAVAPHALLILETIRREQHLIIRELGRSILLMLDEQNAAQLCPEDRNFVKKLNRSQLPPIERNERFPRNRKRDKEAQKRKYSFDDMDAIPYWYQPVASLFGMSMDAFLDRLEYWIHEKWGYGETASHWVEEPRRDRLEHIENATSRRHGLRPMIERLSYHIEWHAMMCAVGELIIEQPLVKQEEEDRFERWMYDSMPTVEPQWLSDLRTPPPLEPRFWGLAPSAVPYSRGSFEEREAEAKAWGRSITSEMFDAEITAADGIVVAADFELRWQGATQRVYVHSALVSPETALALAQALTTARDRMDFALPDACYHEDIDILNFRLNAWLRVAERDPRADKFDTRRGSTSGIPVRPAGTAHSEQLAFHFESSTWRSPGGDTAIAIAQWGSDESANGNGWRATADHAFLAALLARTDRSLILLVEISRQVRDEEIERNPTRWELYILDASSKLVRAERLRRDLGAYLVRREGLSNSVDTLGRWMLHRAAQLDAMREEADPVTRIALDREIDDLCAAFRMRQRY